MSPESRRIDILKDRSAMLSKARQFFQKLHMIEVDCPLMSASASVDAHIDLIPAHPFSGTRYLHSSPEYGMKRLLSEGIGDIYQLAHVFRDGECGVKHNPEFMMAEWYRVGISFHDLIQDTANFACLFLSDLPLEILTYREAFLRYAGFDYVKISDAELVQYIRSLNVEVYPNVVDEGKDALLNQILGLVVEPKLGENGLCALAYYPASQAALAQIKQHGDERVCERFELYYHGIELANGYHELADPVEQRQRLVEANVQRQSMGKGVLPIDENFLKALEVGMPDCCGVAVGFDRLMMLRHQAKDIAEVIPFGWERA